MNRRFFLILSIVVLTGIQPVFAQQDESAARAENTTIDMESASDNEFTQALDASSDVELVNKHGEPSSEEKPAEKPAIAEETPAATTEPAVAEEPPVAAEQPAIAEETPAATEPAVAEEPPATTEQPAIAEETPAVTEQPTVAEETPTATEPAVAEETPATTEQEIPDNIRNNQFLLESQRLTKLAEEAYNYGDYDASAGFAEEAIRAAELSDEYIAQQMGIPVGTPAADGTFPLPATYTVRTWGVSSDCFWNIAGRPWVYGDPRQWRVLYNANKSKLPDPNNPNLIEPGIVLDIPSLKGEVRQGAWDGTKAYTTH
ncbi:MAG: hypothetical protein LBH20_07985 [Treponema sp.]|jgi:nucleoid-associated protein YgaU|nr:hypothetical protein [Treponema sp.]